MSHVQYLQIKTTPQVQLEEGGGGNFPLAYVGSRAGGDNRKSVRSAQRRVVPKACLTASALCTCARAAREGELSLVLALPPHKNIPLNVQKIQMFSQLSPAVEW